MIYSEELIKQVKELYPNDAYILALAENGSVWLGRYLDDGSMGSVSIEEILLATSLEEIQERARLLKRRRSLYNKWCNEDPRKPKNH